MNLQVFGSVRLETDPHKTLGVQVSKTGGMPD